MSLSIIKAAPRDKREKLFKLGDIKPGDGFYIRFRDVNVEEVFDNKSEAQLFMVIDSQQKKSDRVTIVSADGKLVLERDADRMVYKHSVQLVVDEAVTE